LTHPAANLVLTDTVERIYHRDVFAEQRMGLYLIRGENVVLLGEIVSGPGDRLGLLS
jgi:small nuclear ribonucleoprotein (snRNP)-like protein